MAGYSYYTPGYTPNYYAYNPYHVPYQAQAMAQPAPNVQQNIQQTQNPSSILWVRNGQEAAMYPVSPNNAVALWDSSAPVIYLKQADASGKPTMKTYDLVERTELAQNEVLTQDGKDNAYATKSELATLAGAVKDVDGVIASIKEDVDALKAKSVGKNKKVEEEND